MTKLQLKFSKSKTHFENLEAEKKEVVF